MVRWKVSATTTMVMMMMIIIIIIMIIIIIIISKGTQIIRIVKNLMMSSTSSSLGSTSDWEGIVSNLVKTFSYQVDTHDTPSISWDAIVCLLHNVAGDSLFCIFYLYVIKQKIKVSYLVDGTWLFPAVPLAPPYFLVVSRSCKRNAK